MLDITNDNPVLPAGSQLHEALARELLARVVGGEATSADLNVARQFLKDNGVDSLLRKPEAPIYKLSQALPFADPEGEGYPGLSRLA